MAIRTSPPGYNDRELWFNVHSAEDSTQFPRLAKAGAKGARFDVVPGQWQDVPKYRYWIRRSAALCLDLDLRLMPLMTSNPVKNHTKTQLKTWERALATGYVRPDHQTRMAPEGTGLTWWLDDYLAPVVDMLKGRGAIWDIWNEPNWWRGFMTEDFVVDRLMSKTATDQYIDLVEKACAVIRRVGGPKEIIAINTAGTDLQWWVNVLPRALAAGVRQILPHPYVQTYYRYTTALYDGPPEEAVGGLAGVYALANYLNPTKATISKGIGEWGYKNDGLVAQAEYHGRMFEVARAAKANLVVVYNSSHTDLPWETLRLDRPYWDAVQAGTKIPPAAPIPPVSVPDMSSETTGAKTDVFDDDA